MQPTGTTTFLKRIYYQIIGSLKFRELFVSIFLGLVTSWQIKGTITPLLFWGKSFDGRSLFYKVIILAVYVFFTSAFFFGVLMMAGTLLTKLGKTPFYHRVSEAIIRFLSYALLDSWTSDIRNGQAASNTEEQTHSDNSSGFSSEKNGSFNNIVDWFRSYWIYVLIYAFFLYVSSTSARSGDDWEVSNWYQTGFLSTFAEMIHLMTYFNARVVGNFYSAFFTHYDIIWRFTVPAIFTSVIYLMARLFGYVRRPIPVGISFLMLLSVSDGIRLETYVWMIGSGSITIIALILLYLNIIYDENTNNKLRFWQYEPLNYIMVALLAFVTGLFVETATAALTAASILLAILSYLKTRKISPYVSYGFVGCILSCFVLFSTPNTLAIEGLKVGLTQRLVHNLPGVMRLLVVDNLRIYLLFFIVLIVFILAGKVNLGSKTFRVVYVILASLIAIIIFTKLALQFAQPMWWYSSFGNIHSFINNIFFDVNRPLPLVFCFMILLFVLLTAFISKQKEKILVLFCVGTISSGSLLAAPYLGARVFTLPIFMLVSITTYLASTVWIKSVDLRKAALLALIFLTFLRVEKFYYDGEYVRRIENIRLQLIDNYRTRLANGSDTDYLVLPVFREGTVGLNANIPFNGYYMQIFKRYHHLPPDANIIFDDGFALIDFVVTRQYGLNYKFEVTPLYDISTYTYEFVVRKDGNIIYTSVAKAENFDHYEFPGKGAYTISCILTSTAGRREVYSSYYQFAPLEIK